LVAAVLCASHPCRFARRSSFSFPDPAAPPLHPLSLHDALPISQIPCRWPASMVILISRSTAGWWGLAKGSSLAFWRSSAQVNWRSEEHTSELQSRFDLVCRLLLEKKNGVVRRGVAVACFRAQPI